MPTWRKEHMDTLTTATPSVHRKYFRHILGACGSCYFERQAGKFILGEEGDQFFSAYVREDSAYRIERMESESPLGYQTSGAIPV
ncbi:hypothetical protein CQP30_04775 [Yersinia pestis]|uniref:Uncharacterized protein n=5 Tax=Yersinia pseudotuberculosis complex TaxID=1649845 RepID=A0A2U2H354_YERPE|nr:hypothetical protein YP_2951 [Yersinia pestis biovar Microtus str. 91001]AYW83483.1 hypothetical protein EGX42_11185 [Yersinia pestis]AYW91831.1 hypothetical protein EGX47_11270 [Yersinia pseudotuberculosis]EDM39818.1 hypothetical protein YPE_2634 [Yersinia pestis CA88-4125]OSZ91027.1 hypothetical protein A7725_06510 [Yersinia pestis subsp. microtus bv. Caucasica]OUY15946.1 hypothetical protein BFI40_06850 [Yersinia pestis subsp. microtus bv. Altaica]OVY77339.1 hypothetical protein BFI50_0